MLMTKRLQENDVKNLGQNVKKTRVVLHLAPTPPPPTM